MAQGHKSVTVTQRLWVRSPLVEMKCLFKFICSFLRYGVEAKSSVEFRHSTRNTSQIRRKVGNGLSPSAFPAVRGIQREVDLIF